MHLRLQIAHIMLRLFACVIFTEYKKKTIATLNIASQNFFIENTGKPLLVIAKVRNKYTGTLPQMGKIEKYLEEPLLA